MKTIEKPRNEIDWTGAAMIDDKPSASSRILIFMLCAAVVWTTLAYGMVDAWALACFCLFAAATAFLWIADAWKTRELRFTTSLLPLPILGMIVVGAIQLLPLRAVDLPGDLLNVPASAAFSLDAFATKLAIVQLAAMLVLFVAALTFINNQKRLQTVTFTIVVFGFLLAIFSVLQHFTSDNKIYWVREPSQAMIFGSFINRHHFAACLLMMASLTLGLLYAGAVDAQKRALHVFAVVVMSVALLLTGSRGALISLLGVLIFLTVAAFVKTKKRDSEDDENGDAKRFAIKRLLIFGGGLALIAAILLGVLLLGGESGLLRGLGYDGDATRDISNGRFHFWQTTVEVIKENWFFGVGLDALGMAFTRYDTWNGLFRIERAHNDYLQILAEGGVVGLALVAAFVVLLFWQGLRVFAAARDNFRRGVCLGALAGCLAIMIHSIFDFPLRTPSNLLLFLTLAALATVEINYPKLYRRRSKASKK